MSVYQPAGHLGKAPVADAERQCPVPVEDAVSRRHHARHLRTPRQHRLERCWTAAGGPEGRRAGRPEHCIARLAALVPKPRVPTCQADALCSYHPDTRPFRGPAKAVKIRSRRIFHGVFAPNSEYRARVTPAKRGRGGRHATTAGPEERTAAEGRAAMAWAQRLKRVLGIDIETCSACGGAVRIIACIEDPASIEKIPSLGS